MSPSLNSVMHDISAIIDPDPSPLSGDTQIGWTVVIQKTIITPFLQGLFYGLGEGIARIMVGRAVGVDPVSALTYRLSPKASRNKIAKA